MTAIDEPIRILRVIARLNVGGPALHVSYLASELDKRGYETKLVAGRVSDGEGSMEFVARDRGVAVQFIPELQREIHAGVDLRAVWRLRGLIREFRPHILHTHTAKAGAVGRLAALISGSARPGVIVHTFHGHVLRGYFGRLSTTLFRLLETTLARVSDVLIAVSPEVRDDLVRLRVAPESRIRVIRLGIDLEDRTSFAAGARGVMRDELGVPGDRFVIGWLGRMTEIKRVDVLLSAFAILRDQGVDADLVLSGDGPLRDELVAQAELLGIADRCHFIGFRSDVGAVLTGLDTFVLTSANEGTPVTLIEASAAGLPVVSTNVGGVSDVVLADRTGLLVAVGDQRAIADCLGRLAADAELRERLGEQGRAFVSARYSIPRLVDDMDELYRELLDRPRAKFAHAELPERVPPTLPPAAPPRAGLKLRVLMLSQYFPPEIGATQMRMQAFAEYLAGRGHDVTVICEMPNHPHGIIPSRYRGLVYADDASNDYRVRRVWVKASPEKTQRSRIAFYLSYMGLATAVAPFVGGADVVFATSPPLFTGAAGLAIAQMLGAPLVLDVRDLWPAAAVSLKQMGEGSSLRLAEWLERRLYRQAAVVTAVTRPFCEHIDAVRGKPPGTVLLPNGTLELFLDDTTPADRSELGAPDGTFVVTFAGTHGIAQALPSVLEAAALVRDGIHFAFVGDGPTKAMLVDRARQLKLTNVHFHDQVPLEQMPRLLRASDALLVPLAAHPTFEAFVPSKLLDFMAVGRPVVLAAAGESRRLLDAAAAGIGVAPEDPAALAGALESLADDPGAAQAFGRRGREFARSRTRIAQAERLEHILTSVARARA